VNGDQFAVALHVLAVVTFRHVGHRDVDRALTSSTPPGPLATRSSVGLPGMGTS
jgi:hypothetical protein